MNLILNEINSVELSQLLFLNYFTNVKIDWDFFWDTNPSPGFVLQIYLSSLQPKSFFSILFSSTLFSKDAPDFFGCPSVNF